MTHHSHGCEIGRKRGQRGVTTKCYTEATHHSPHFVTAPHHSCISVPYAPLHTHTPQRACSMTVLPPQMDRVIKKYLALKSELGTFDLDQAALSGQYLFTSMDDGSRPYPTSSWTKVVKVRSRRSLMSDCHRRRTHDPCDAHITPRGRTLFEFIRQVTRALHRRRCGASS